ncbi:SDR family NAD(P)-dependent oxidoreductase [Microbacterium sp. cf332]|uniref:SDR family NAD(P)-dependent oxidoreductase n=1 Tax=Microbacterium sp. cf332 TaxID=1761804 RepID=UPI000880F190|nr:SDR family NAD(P)-dependent oxidoreductase [Microbacterium sp. cf332]SDQ51369.1 Rhamnose utilisation protein RhaD, predicted bifunctional aldolase and dehydrogenase [Microbacterium sp. cf332]
MTPSRDVSDALDEIVRVSRALGDDPSFVLHGGGNTSITARGEDVTGEPVDLVLVKGSGWDLATIEPAGFAPLRRDRLERLLRLPHLDDPTMVNELRQASLDATAPTASIEALLHAHLPGRVALHSHADAIVAVTDRDVPDDEIAAALGPRVAVLPYVMPGFPLARLVADTDLSGVDALVLRNHGLFTFGDDPDAVLARHREIVARAAEVSRIVAPETNAGETDAGDHDLPPRGTLETIAGLRADIARAAGRPMLLRQSRSRRAAAFAGRTDLDAATTRGTATPEHVIYTKRHPLIGRDVAAYASAYRAYVERHRHRQTGPVTPLDPAPRVVFDGELGMLTAGDTVRDVGVAADIAEHTIAVIEAADALGGYRSLDEAQSFDIEYWSLEQAKLAGRRRAPLAGEVAIVTGAASGIGRAAAERLLTDGAAVVGVDLDPGVQLTFSGDAWRGVVGDVADPAVIERTLDEAVRAYGGVDMLVVAAGIFPRSQDIAELDEATWERALRVNATAPLRLMRAAHGLLARSPRGGRVVLVSTKNVAAPGPGVAAYSASKTAAAQLARVAALEWAADGIRVNQVEPDAVFDTAIWTPELLAERAASYGLSVEAYRTRNLLRIEVSSAMVAEAVAVFCEQLPATTGAHLSVDGGNDRVI